MNRSAITLVTAILLLVCATAKAATFFPAPDELETLSPQERQLTAEAANRALAKVKPGEKYIRVDDMRFPVEEVSRYSAFTGDRWTDGIVYYEFADSVASENRSRWLEAAREWRAVADLSFVRRSDQRRYVYVMSGDENWSEVGMGSGERQMEITSWGSKFVIAHEIGHLLGMKHEHQRPDRDDYVEILWDNIETDKAHNFNKASSAATYASYDFLSVMHYSKGAFSTGGNTIEPLPDYTGYLNLIGQRSYFSASDKQGMATRYGSVPPEVTYPRYSGLEWRLGSHQKISWRGFTDDAVYVDLYRGTVLDRRIANFVRERSVEWDVPEDVIPAWTYRIRVTSSSNPTTWAESANPFAIIRAPKVTQPDVAGLRWQAGETYDITWRNIIGLRVFIELYDVGTDSLIHTISSSTYNDEIHRWTIPTDIRLDEDYKIRVAPLDDPWKDDFSDEPFAIVCEAQVLSPEWGDTWEIGRTWQIEWTPCALDDTVDIVLFNGTSEMATLAEGTANDGSFSWTIPEDQWLSPDYRLHVVSTTEPSREGISGRFAIEGGEYRVLFPEERGVDLQRGMPYFIRWDGFVGEQVSVELIRDLYLSVETISEATTNDGLMRWFVPYDIAIRPDSFYQFRVSSVLNPSQSASSEYFWIADPPPTVVEPSESGIVWEPGAPYVVRWTGFGRTENVKIDLYKGKTFAGTLAASTPNDAYFSGTLSTKVEQGNDYSVRVSSVDDPETMDHSDNYFIIYTEGDPVVTRPTAPGITMRRGEVYAIRWAGFSDKTVNIDLHRDGEFLRDVTATALSSGVCYWLVPDDLAVGPGYTIHIRGVFTPKESDESNSDFFIQGDQEVLTPATPGLVWRRGEPYLIEWRGFSDKAVEIDLMRGAEVMHEVSSLHPNRGRLTWTVDDDAPLGTSYTLRVQSTSNPWQADESQYLLTLEGSQRVTAPAGATTFWRYGADVSIAWAGFASEQVSVGLYLGDERVGLIASATENVGKLAWTVSEKIPAGTDYRVRVSSTTDPFETAQSLYPVVVAGPPRVESPTGPKTVWVAGETYIITWSGFASPFLDVLLYRGIFDSQGNGGFLDHAIAEGIPNRGSLAWTIPPSQTPSSACRVVVRSAENPSLPSLPVKIGPAEAAISADSFEVRAPVERTTGAEIPWVLWR